MKELRWEGDVHPGTAGLSAAIEALGDELAQRVSRLVNTGCVATIAVVQELTTDTYSHGLALSAAATAWMGSAKAGLTVDQYVDSM
jgi:predicted transcriptional regulator